MSEKRSIIFVHIFQLDNDLCFVVHFFEEFLDIFDRHFSITSSSQPLDADAPLFPRRNRVLLLGDGLCGDDVLPGDYGLALAHEALDIVLRGVVLAVAIIFIIVGIVNGGMADVLGKAIRLCTECIGLG